MIEKIIDTLITFVFILLFHFFFMDKKMRFHRNRAEL